MSGLFETPRTMHANAKAGMTRRTSNASWGLDIGASATTKPREARAFDRRFRHLQLGLTRMELVRYNRGHRNSGRLGGARCQRAVGVWRRSAVNLAELVP